MADGLRRLISAEPEIRFARDRVDRLIEQLERLASGDTTTRLSISSMHDELDAVALGINVMADELRWVRARMAEFGPTGPVEHDEHDRHAVALRDELAHVGRLTMLDAISGSLAHEVNQPLTAVMANTEAALRLLACRPPRLGEIRETLDEILRDNKRAVDMLLRMRTFLKKGSSNYEPVSLNSTVTDVVRLVQGSAISRRIALNVQLGSGIGPIRGDRIEIQQVVLNLLLNAFDAVQESRTADRLVSVRTSSAGQDAIVAVIDDGPGLAEEELAQIFRPFYTTKRNGMGLGLSICRTIVAAHGGAIEVTRNPDHGMTFSVRLPLWDQS